MAANSVGHVIALAEARLTASESAKLDAQLLLLHALQRPRTFLFTHADHVLSDIQYQQFEALLQRRIKGEPIAYIMGQTGFWDLTLKVSPATLIPRADTESLIDFISANCEAKSILDLGTGTGALALALAYEFPNAHVLAVDLIEDAVALASENAKLNHLSNVECLQSDWFASVPKRCFDLIVSNPPYIDPDDHHLDQGDVRFEPKSALIADNKGLADIEHICQQARPFMQQGAMLVIEHGFQQGHSVRTIFEAAGFANVQTRPDLAGRDRFTLGYLS